MTGSSDDLDYLAAVVAGMTAAMPWKAGGESKSQRYPGCSVTIDQENGPGIRWFVVNAGSPTENAANARGLALLHNVAAAVVAELRAGRALHEAEQACDDAMAAFLGDNTPMGDVATRVAEARTTYDAAIAATRAVVARERGDG